MAAESAETTLINAIIDGETTVAREVLTRNAHLIDRFSSSHWKTPMIVAAHFGRNQIILTLMEMKCTTLDNIDDMKQTPLHHATKRGHLSSVQLLLKVGSRSMDVLDASGRTPLHLAVITQEQEILKFLIDYGCNINVHSGNHVTPFSSAISIQNFAAAQLLYNTGRQDLDPFKVHFFGGPHVLYYQQLLHFLSRGEMNKSHHESYIIFHDESPKVSFQTPN